MSYYLILLQEDWIPIFGNMRYVFTEVALEHEVLVGAHDFIMINILVVRKG